MAVKPVYFAESQVKVGSANLFACLMCVEIKTSLKKKKSPVAPPAFLGQLSVHQAAWSLATTSLSTAHTEGWMGRRFCLHSWAHITTKPRLHSRAHIYASWCTPWPWSLPPAWKSVSTSLHHSAITRADGKYAAWHQTCLFPSINRLQ